MSPVRLAAAVTLVAILLQAALMVGMYLGVESKCKTDQFFTSQAS